VNGPRGNWAVGLVMVLLSVGEGGRVSVGRG
jgi:hypothetical protein